MASQPQPSSLSNIKHIVLILSGKGGVGKSSTTLQLALTLSLLSPTTRIGILDIDLTGPNIPRLLDVEHHRITQTASGWTPVLAIPATTTHGSISCMSLAFLLPTRTSSVVWRGPKKTAMVRQFLSDVDWSGGDAGDAGGGGGLGLDYLLIDTPPGTSDEHISLIESLLQLPTTRPRGAVIVTTPQAVATADVRKELSFCATVGVRVLGVVENMSGFMCPCCGVVTEVFSMGGGERMAREVGVEFWGGVPLDGGFVGLVEKRRGGGEGGGEGKEQGEGEGEEKGEGLLERYLRCGLCKVFEGLAAKLVDSCERAKAEDEAAAGGS